MAGLNKVMLIGNLGRNPEIRYSQQGSAVVNFPLATNEQWIDKSTGEKQEKTEWHRVVAFGKQAEILEKYLSKGRQVYIEGRLQTRAYEKDGQTHHTTEVMVTSFRFVGGGGDDSQGGYQQPKQQTAGSNQSQGHGRQSWGSQKHPQDDDIPF